MPILAQTPNNTTPPISAGRAAAPLAIIGAGLLSFLLPWLFVYRLDIAALLLGGIIAAALVVYAGPFAIFAAYYFTSLTTTGIPLPHAPISLNRIFYIIFALSFAKEFISGRIAIPRGKAAIFTAALALFLTISALTGKSPEAGTIAAKTTITLFVISALAAAVAISTGRFRAFSWSILAPTLAGAAVALVEAVARRDYFGGYVDFFHGYFRVNGISPNSIVFSQTCLFAIPFGLWLSRHAPGHLERTLAIGAAMICLCAAMLTFNRQTMLLAPALVLFAAFVFRGRLAVVLIGVVACISLAAGPILLPAVVARLQTVGDLRRDYSFMERRDKVINAYAVWSHAPAFGVGMGSYPRVWRDMRSPDTFLMQYDWGPRETDMNYMRLLAETGAVGLGASLLYYLATLIAVSRTRKKIRNDPDLIAQADIGALLLLLWALFLLSSAIQDTTLYLRTWLMFALSAAYISHIAQLGPSRIPNNPRAS